jgi:hypothetical protein
MSVWSQAEKRDQTCRVARQRLQEKTLSGVEKLKETTASREPSRLAAVRKPGSSVLPWDWLCKVRVNLP